MARPRVRGAGTCCASPARACCIQTRRCGPIASAWARWQLTMPPWCRPLRATGVGVSVYAAIGVVVTPMFLLLPGEVTVVQNDGWVVLTGWQFGWLVYRFGVIPWLDARVIDWLPWPSSRHEAVSG